ncbi:hypothetical protein [Sphingomonas sp. R1]|uniref:hypothetical protein n=1 Tax=Sphingomonas sp. R1 TaxID=399176 RepID=UPI002225B414|nr:hypothetical protein [Sphingomonas sp. R1]UYY77357.1 hypothetical protein OIM94_17980 [Sphingomonas sp. R1]
MTDLPPYLAIAQNWTFALRVLMGYPRQAPPFHTIGWCATGCTGPLQAPQLTRLAAELQRDMVQILMPANNEAPRELALAVREGMNIRFRGGLRLYAASDNARLELLAGDRRWFIGPRHVLTSAKLPPNHRRDAGERIALRRWRQVFEQEQSLRLEGNLLVPAGSGIAESQRLDDLKIAC